MPEGTDWAVRRSGGATAEVAGGFWIRRGSLPTAVTGPRRRRGCAPSGTDNKENIPSAVGSTWCPRARARPRRSPLPEWYPRTPLRDITIIVKALERQRNRMRAAAARQRIHDSVVSPQTGLLESHVPDELGVSDHTPSPVPPADLSDSSSNPPVANSSSEVPTELPLQTSSSPSCLAPAELPLQTSSSPSCLTPAELPSQTASIATSPAPCDLKAIESDKKLQSSIDKIESVLMENLKRNQQVPIRKSTRTLMSMR